MVISMQRTLPYRTQSADPTAEPREQILAVVDSLQAMDPLTSQEDLRKLAQHGNSDIRRHVAQNPATAADILHDLARDADSDVRLAAVQHPAATGADVLLLESDPSPDVAAAARWERVLRGVPHLTGQRRQVAGELAFTWPGTLEELILCTDTVLARPR